MTLRYNLQINQGETWRLAIPVLDADGELVNLSGSVVRGQIRASLPSSGVALHTWAEAESNVDIALGEIVLHVPAAVSEDWSWTVGMWDLEVTDLAGSTTRLIEGIVRVRPEVTKG